MDISVIINQLIQLFVMIFLGYLLCSIGILDHHTNQRMTKVIIQLTSPCLILSSVLTSNAEKNLSLIGLTFLIATIYYLVSPFVGMLMTPMLRLPKEQRGMYAFMAVFENTGFMGIPVINAVYGGEGLVYTAIFNIVFNIACFGYGPMLITNGSGKKVKVNLKSIFSPGLIMSFFTLAVYIWDIPIPGTLVGVISSLGNVTTPMAMILTGSALALMDIREVFTDLHVYPFIAVRHIFLPLLIFPLMARLISNTVLLGVCFIMIIMPCASMSVLFATNYNADEKLAARTVFISTMLSLLTIPLLLSICLV